MKFQAPDNTALIIIDVQNDFCPGGALAVNEGNLIVPTINELAASFNTVVLTQDFHPEGHSSFASQHDTEAPTVEMDYGTQILWPDHCVQGTRGAEFHSDLEIRPSDLIIQKGKNPNIDSYSAFFENDKRTEPTFDDGLTLAETLEARGIENLVMVGLADDFCVGHSALDGIKKGFNVAVVTSAVRGIALETTENSNTMLDMIASQEEAGVQRIDVADVPAFAAS